MSFDLKHLPRTFDDLVIADPLNAAVIQQYCTQPPSKPLLLAGAHQVRAKQKLPV